MNKEEKIYAVVIAVAFVALMLAGYMEFVQNTANSVLDDPLFSPEESGLNVTRLLIFVLVAVVLAILIIWVLKKIGFGKRIKKKKVTKTKARKKILEKVKAKKTRGKKKRSK